MSWTFTAVEHLAAHNPWGYRAGSSGASEPTALAALALAGASKEPAAALACKWLGDHQNRDGSVGVTAEQSTPCWTTSLAVLAWRLAAGSAETEYRRAIDSALDWLLNTRGETLPRTPQLGHDTTLAGWPWVAGTHSWLEPTCWAVLALKATGHGQSPRAREGVRLIIDRLLPTGGCNYGNTFVLGQKLRPQLEPTGLAMLALAGERDAAGRIDASSDYLSRNISRETPAISLSYALLGLAAQEQSPDSAADCLQAAYEHTAARGNAPLKLALLLLAEQGAGSPLMIAARGAEENA